jgi:hypothetical protein
MYVCISYDLGWKFVQIFVDANLPNLSSAEMEFLKIDPWMMIHGIRP